MHRLLNLKKNSVQYAQKQLISLYGYMYINVY